MKKILVKIVFSMVLVIAQFTNLLAQSSKLDQKNGFNKFQLGTSLSTIQDIAKLKKVNNDVTNSESYIITDVGNYSITGYEIQNILLTFYKKKLFRISVMMPQINARAGSLSKIQSTTVLDKIIAEYGTTQALDLTEDDRANNIVVKSLISGNAVMLFIVQYGLEWIDEQPFAKGNIYTFMSKDIYRQMEKDLANDSGF